MMAPWNDSEFPDDQPDGEENEYRPISGLAVVAFVLALLSLFAWVNGAMGFVALIGMILALIALRRIAHSDPPMLGKKLAWAALALSLICTVGVAADWYAYRLLIRQEAREYAEYWIHLQLQGESHEALRLVQVTSLAHMGLNSQNATPGEIAEARLKAYCDWPVVRAITALGSASQIRYYDTEGQQHVGRDDTLKQVYAVTYNKEGKKTTFFIRMAMERKVPEDKAVGVWRILNIESGVKPIALGGTEET